MLHTVHSKAAARAVSSLRCIQVWQTKMGWLSQQLTKAGLKDCRCRLLKAHEVYDETMADQFRILAGSPRGPISAW